MTVPVQTTFTASTANGVTTSFPYAFKITDADDLEVSVDGVVQTTGFTVTGVGAELGGNVNFDVAPTNGARVIRALSPILKRTTDYQQFGDWDADEVDNDFDRIWLALQALSQNTSRALKLPKDTADDQVLTEEAADRTGMLVSFDSSGNMTLVSAADVDLATVSAFILTLLDDASATSARTTLGAAASGTNSDITTLAASTGVAVKGIPNAGDATAGNVGEYIESVVGSTSAPSSGAYGDLTSITLTAGDWDLSAIVTGELNGATLTSMLAGIGTTTGNDGSGLVYGDNSGNFLPTSANRAGVTVPPKRVRLASTTTYYLKMMAAYSAGTPKFYGRISARRMR